MGVENFKLVQSRTVGSANQKAVLLRMAWASHDDGTNCYVSKKRMMAETEIPRSTFYQEIKRLEQRGLVCRAGKEGLRINYNLNLGAIKCLPTAYLTSDVHVNTNRFQKQKRSEAPTVRQGDVVGPQAGLNESGDRTRMKSNEKNNKRSPDPKRAPSHRATSANEDNADTMEKYIASMAKKISEECYVAPSAVTTGQAGYMLQLGLVTEEKLRAAGIAF